MNAQSAPAAPNIPYGPIISGAFALLVLVGASMPWTTQFGARNEAGFDYARGIVTVVASMIILGVCLFRSLGSMSKGSYLVLISTFTAITLAMPLWIYAGVVGDRDPGLDNPAWKNYMVPWATIMGRTGLAMAIVSASGLAFSVVWQIATPLVQWPRRVGAPTTVLLTGTLAMFALAGALLPWSKGAEWSRLGVEYTAGLVVLVAAIDIMIVVALRTFGHISHLTYLKFAGAAAAALLGAPVWFYGFTIGQADPFYDNALIECYRNPCGTIGAEPGLAVATIAAFGCAAALLADGRTSIRGVRDARTSRRARRLTAILRGFPIIRRADN